VDGVAALIIFSEFLPGFFETQRREDAKNIRGMGGVRLQFFRFLRLRTLAFLLLIFQAFASWRLCV
jgi:hypothetical protein